MKKEFVMRGSTASGTQEVLNFSGYKPGYAYRMTEFSLYPSTNIGNTTYELIGSVTAGKTFEDPVNPNFSNEGLIAVAMNFGDHREEYPESQNQIVNDTFLITQNLILAVIDTKTGSPMAVNWQCRFMSVKMNDAEEAATNFKQFTISDE